jgi:hypothetical protein
MKPLIGRLEKLEAASVKLPRQKYVLFSMSAGETEDEAIAREMQDRELTERPENIIFLVPLKKEARVQ